MPIARPTEHGIELSFACLIFSGNAASAEVSTEPATTTTRLANRASNRMCRNASTAAPLNKPAAPNCRRNSASAAVAAAISSIKWNAPPGLRSDKLLAISVQFSCAEPHSGIDCN
jgi:hypothetical protein